MCFTVASFALNTVSFARSCQVLLSEVPGHHTLGDLFVPEIFEIKKFVQFEMCCGPCSAQVDSPKLKTSLLPVKLPKGTSEFDPMG